MLRHAVAVALCAVLAPGAAGAAAGSVGSRVHATAAERHARCISKPYPGERWCPAEWAARPSWHRSSRWFVPEPWLRAKLARIRSCESGGRYGIATGNGFFGAYQFLASTWRSQGGRGLPHLASPAEQDFRAARLYRAAGPGPWPVCGYR